MPDALRLFVGLDVGPIWTERLSATASRAAKQVGSSGRLVRPELYHVTVVFLGNQPSDAVKAIGAAIAESAAQVAPFALRLRELLRLGRHERGALVAGVDDPSGALQRFRTHLDVELARRSIAFDAKSLVPHVTLIRPRKGAGILPLPPADLRSTPSLTVHEVALVQSTISQTGPRYDSIITARFGS